jgi:hypothetical protein
VAKPDWRSAADYDYLDFADPADIAWEFLRRNASYAAEYRQIADKEFPCGSSRQAVLAEFAARWGLRFRGTPDECE